MALHRQTFITRTITAVVFVVVMLIGLLVNTWSFLLLFSLIHFGCWLEYQKLIGLIDRRYAALTTLHKYGIILTGAGLLAAMINQDVSNASRNVHNIGVILSMAGLAMVLFDLLKNPTKNNGVALIYSLLGLLYITLPWVCMMAIRATEAMFNDTSTHYALPYLIPIILIASIWINDTMAYLVGSFIGKTSLSKISPKKTWEGTIGGGILCVATVSLVGYYAVKFNDITSLIIISATAAVIGTLGDLLQSKLKRAAGVKDSGNFMPGHGGFLDRFDSLLLVTPFICFYVFFFMVRFNW